ncbi:helix-turn-helix domain-containing protein [Streptomyces sp. NBC_01210]|uniref:PucR family transcriptional regulator n=1 Tax=Streptomyces sp. NBC_01210 TaxID=2903774 RepID=UPI002E11AECC|nr:helix-turn-helix domain-containing protein [Streptomyces sp. NBC_01210]
MLAALTGEPEAPQADIAELARAAAWRIPPTVRAVVTLAHVWASPWSYQDKEILAAPIDEELHLVVPESSAHSKPPLTPRCNWTAAVGPAVPAAKAGVSLRWARRLLDIVPPSDSPGARLLHVDDHLTMLLLLQDPSLVNLFVGHWLRPLEKLTPRQSERVVQTLVAWWNEGSTRGAAALLNVHPQTIRYRMRQIEKLFGSALHTPENRFELQLALRMVQLTAEVDPDGVPLRQPMQ